MISYTGTSKNSSSKFKKRISSVKNETLLILKPTETAYSVL